MLDPSETLQLSMAAQNALDWRGYFIFPQRLISKQVAGIRARLEEINWHRTPLSEQDTSQYWSEADLQGEKLIQSEILSTNVEHVVSKLKERPKSQAFWANRYGAGEFIPRHTDNDGGLQMLTGITLTPKCRGGETIFHHGGSQVVVVKPGMQVLFNACTTPHETTPLVNPSGSFCERVVCVTRFYFDD